MIDEDFGDVLDGDDVGIGRRVVEMEDGVFSFAIEHDIGFSVDCSFSIPRCIAPAAVGQTVHTHLDPFCCRMLETRNIVAQGLVQTGIADGVRGRRQRFAVPAELHEFINEQVTVLLQNGVIEDAVGFVP